MRKLFALVVSVGVLLAIMPMQTSAGRDYLPICNEIGEKYGICPELIQAIVEKESNYNENAVSSHGAIGLMQVIPRWNQDRMDRLGVTDLTDPYQNILCGTDLISELADKYEDLYLVLMCYNQGEYGGAIEQWENGQYSDYAVSIVERTAELEEAHGKHAY